MWDRGSHVLFCNQTLPTWHHSLFWQEELELRRRRARFTFLLSVVSSVIFAAKRQRRTDGLRQFPPSSPPFPGLQLSEVAAAAAGVTLHRRADIELLFSRR